jgi:hypothetical protein
MHARRGSWSTHGRRSDGLRVIVGLRDPLRTAPLDLDDDRFLRAWVSAVVIALIPEAVQGRSARSAALGEPGPQKPSGTEFPAPRRSASIA